MSALSTRPTPEACEVATVHVPGSIRATEALADVLPEQQTLLLRGQSDVGHLVPGL